MASGRPKPFPVARQYSSHWRYGTLYRRVGRRMVTALAELNNAGAVGILTKRVDSTLCPVQPFKKQELHSFD